MPTGCSAGTPPIDLNAQVVALDYFRLSGTLDDHILFVDGDAWIRSSEATRVGTTIVLHLVLPELYTPIVITGVVGPTDARTWQHPGWCCIELHDEPSDDNRLLRIYLAGLSNALLH